MEFNKSGLDLFVFIGTLFTVFTVGAASLDGGDVIQFRNILRPFSTDGCSRFPDGIPLLKPNLWLNCCVEHDVSYWQGGTDEQRADADAALAKCVNKATDSALGNDMWIGVRMGGFVGLPTSWHWGYGWVLDRGYAPLNTTEKEQVAKLQSRIPTDFTKLQIEDSFLIRDRQTITGNLCLDQAFMFIRSELKKDFNVSELKKTNYIKFGDNYENFEIKVEGCTDPYKIEFQILKKDACVVKQNELLARGRIRMQKVQRPAVTSCSPI